MALTEALDLVFRMLVRWDLVLVTVNLQLIVDLGLNALLMAAVVAKIKNAQVLPERFS